MYHKEFLLGISICILLGVNCFSQNEITVTMSASTVRGVANYNNGIQFTLRNMESNLLYHSKPLKKPPTYTKHAIIKDLPRGKYEMYFIGPIDYIKRDDDVVKFFGILDFTKYDGYYLGSFKGKIPVGYNKPCYLKLESMEVPKRISKICRRRGYLSDDEELFSDFNYSSNDFVLPPLR